jgi:hypothetical protein
MVKVERPPQISRKDDLQLNDVKKMSWELLAFLKKGEDFVEDAKYWKRWSKQKIAVKKSSSS